MQSLLEATKNIKAIEGVQEVVSLATVSGAAETNGVLSVGTLIDVTPEGDLEQRILGDKLLTPNLISKDGRTVLIYAQLLNANTDLLVQFQSQFNDLLVKSFS